MLCRNWCIDVKYFSRWRNGRNLEILKILHDAIFTLEMHFHEKNSISTSLYEFNISSEQQWFIANTFIFLKNIGGAGSHCLTVTRSQQITLLSKEPCSTNIWIFLILKFSKFTRFDVLMTKNEKIDFGTSGSSRLILLKLETSWKSTIYLTEFFRTILFSGFWKDKHQVLKNGSKTMTKSGKISIWMISSCDFQKWWVWRFQLSGFEISPTEISR